MATISAQDGTDAATTPFAIDGFEGTSESGNIVSELLNGELAVTLYGDRERTGSLKLVYTDDTAAEAARALLARPTSFVLTTPERPVIGFTFVRAGSITTALHDAVRAVWTFSVGFQEVAP